MRVRRGPVAQLVEQGTFNPKVAGSIPARPINESPAQRGCSCLTGSTEIVGDNRWGNARNIALHLSAAEISRLPSVRMAVRDGVARDRVLRSPKSHPGGRRFESA